MSAKLTVVIEIQEDGSSTYSVQYIHEPTGDAWAHYMTCVAHAILWLGLPDPDAFFTPEQRSQIMNKALDIQAVKGAPN